MGDDKSLTISVNEAAKMVGLSRSAFYHWRRRHRINPVPGTSAKRPRYFRDDIEHAERGDPAWMPGMPEPQDKQSPAWTMWEEEMKRRAKEALDYAEQGLDWPPR